jgi:hypothetical protein
VLAAVLLRWLATPGSGRLPDWLFTRARLVELALASAGVAVAFSSNWFPNDVWGVGGPVDYGTLFGISFTAATSAMVGKDVVKNAGA